MSLEAENSGETRPPEPVTRRSWIGSAVALMLVGAAGRRAFGSGVAKVPVGILVYANPGCQCCQAWVKHLERNGFLPAAQMVDDVDPIKRKRGVPEKLWSCHTAIVGNYTVEGHVPADL